EDRHVMIASWRPLGSNGRPLPDDGVERSYSAVFDGHNGSRAAEEAAGRLHTLIAAEPALRTATGCKGPSSMMAAEEEAMRIALVKSFRCLDDSLITQARQDGGRDGSTALVTVRLGDSIYTAHAGDSRAVLCRAGGVAHRLTEDHKPNLPAERSRIESVGGRVEWQRCWRVVVEPGDGRPGSGLAVSRSLGDYDFKEPRKLVDATPEVVRTRLMPGDAFVVLASDGLWDVMTDQDAVDAVRSALQACEGAKAGKPTSADATLAAEAALALAVRRGTVDNVTVLVMALTWS
ncbi:phosphatase 2C-like domain-containing protein, partial [Haematococcus lacustris]